jgi:tellurite resistance protein
MDLEIPPADVIPYGLRAMKMVALASGEIAEQERALLDAAQRMFGTRHALDELPPITPEELAAKLVDPRLRKQLVLGMLLLSLADGEASPEEAGVVEAFARALGVDTHEVKTFRRLSEGRLLLARLDVARRFWVRAHLVAKVKEGGLRWLARSLAAMTGIREDGETAARYRALVDYPEGSLGRAYAGFIRGNGFSFPGEKGSPPEPIVVHDLTHTLSGYGTDPASEICVTAFHAGYRKEDPFTFLLFSMMQFNLGIAVTPITPGVTLNFDAPRVLAALRRGSMMKRDISDGTWDYWADLPRPIDEVRAELGVPPLDA